MKTTKKIGHNLTKEGKRPWEEMAKKANREKTHVPKKVSKTTASVPSCCKRRAHARPEMPPPITATFTIAVGRRGRAVGWRLAMHGDADLVEEVAARVEV